MVANRSIIVGCLLAVVLGACSFDAGKLRTPTAHGTDGAVEAPVAPAEDAADSHGDRPQGDGAPNGNLADAAAFSDTARRADAAHPDGVSPPVDLAFASETSVPESGPVDGPAGNADGDRGSTDGNGGTDGNALPGPDAGENGGDGSAMTGTDADAGTDLGGTDDVGSDSDGTVDSGPPGPDPDLVLWYKFDESSGTIAADSAMFAGVARNATLATNGMGASAVFSTTKRVGSCAVALTPSALSPKTIGGYVVLPSPADLAPDALTIAVWVYLPVSGPAQTWERILDFGDSPTGMKWLNLMARSGDARGGPVEFAISNIGHDTTQALIGKDALSANVWHHIAVVLPAGVPYTGTLYIDGVAVATNNAMTLHLADIGTTTNNWLGRSQFNTDPFFNGSLDDFRVYKRALSKQEITALIAVH